MQRTPGRGREREWDAPPPVLEALFYRLTSNTGEHPRPAKVAGWRSSGNQEYGKSMIRSTRQDEVADYLGADLTDGTPGRRRPIDVCGLTPVDAGFRVSFWTWEWSDQGLESVLSEVRSARCTFIDGPQGLASMGRTMRACDRAASAAAKTGSERDEVRGPYAGFVLSSLGLFRCLHAAGVPVSDSGAAGGVWEVYPALLWRRLASGLSKKTTVAGMAQRRAILERLGQVFERTKLNHDQLDAAVGALAAAASAGKVPGLTVVLLGESLVVRPSGELEEGPIVSLEVEEELRRELAAVAGAGMDKAKEPRAHRISRRRIDELACPIPGCTHVFKGGRGGWDAHVASRKTHPSWMPRELDGPRRKELFRRAFPAFF